MVHSGVEYVPSFWGSDSSQVLPRYMYVVFGDNPVSSYTGLSCQPLSVPPEFPVVSSKQYSTPPGALAVVASILIDVGPVEQGAVFHVLGSAEPENRLLISEVAIALSERPLVRARRDGRVL